MVKLLERLWNWKRNLTLQARQKLKPNLARIIVMHCKNEMLPLYFAKKVEKEMQGLCEWYTKKDAKGEAKKRLWQKKPKTKKGLLVLKLEDQGIGNQIRRVQDEGGCQSVCRKSVQQLLEFPREQNLKPVSRLAKDAKYVQFWGIIVPFYVFHIAFWFLNKRCLFVDCNISFIMF